MVAKIIIISLFTAQSVLNQVCVLAINQPINSCGKIWIGFIRAVRAFLIIRCYGYFLRNHRQRTGNGSNTVIFSYILCAAGNGKSGCDRVITLDSIHYILDTSGGRCIQCIAFSQSVRFRSIPSAGCSFALVGRFAIGGSFIVLILVFCLHSFQNLRHLRIVMCLSVIGKLFTRGNNCDVPLRDLIGLLHRTGIIPLAGDCHDHSSCIRYIFAVLDIIVFRIQYSLSVLDRHCLPMLLSVIFDTLRIANCELLFISKAGCCDTQRTFFEGHMIIRRNISEPTDNISLFFFIRINLRAIRYLRNRRHRKSLHKSLD